VTQLEEAVLEIRERIEELEAVAVLGSVTLNITTFAPEPYSVKKAIPVCVQRGTGGFVASFADANINTSGETQQEAYANLRELLLDVFDSLTALPESKLGPGPRRQLAVLREFVDVPTHHKRARRADPAKA
jgi:predicted RNase H-like HicB family nuclease